MRTRNTSQSDRKRTERDAELRRRRHNRHMSHASERLGRMSQSLDADLPSPPRSSSASSSSVAALPPSTQVDIRPCTAPPVPHNNSINAHNGLLSLFNFGSAPSLPVPSLESSGNASPSASTSRSRSNDGQPRSSESTSDMYGRTLAQIQDQLDSMRALLGSNLADESRNNLVSVTESLNLERAALEEEFRDILADNDESVSDLFATSVWARRRTAVTGGERAWGISHALRSLPSLVDATKDAEKIKNTAAFLYSVEPSQTGSDVWPDIRDPAKLPARYTPVYLPNVSRKIPRSKKPAARRYEACEGWEEEDTSTKIVWPMNALPSEIYYLIADSLSRDDIKAMRLTCQEFEHHISCILFKTVVVPFNTEIYGMLQGMPKRKVDSKGKEKASFPPPCTVEFWKNSKDEDIYTGHGVDVFRSFGPRMKRFGMSFEVNEEVLANPPLKGTREDHKSYWGVYQWPYPEYKRFDQVAGLEDAADETPKMKTAFSFLNHVQELALSLDSGLGWLSGPDRSIRSRLLSEQRPVFGTSRSIPNRDQEARLLLWQYLKDWAAHNQSVDLRHCTIAAQKLTESQTEFTKYQEKLMIMADQSPLFVDLQSLADPTARIMPTPGVSMDVLDGKTSSIDVLMALPMGSECAEIASPFEAGMFFVREDAVDAERLESYPIVPSELSKLQKEWLLETDWAQRAFLSSWLIAVVDNRYTFQHVHTINFARLSSRFLLSLNRDDFWRALPQLRNVVLGVIPDCRDVIKDNAGFVETPRVLPIAAVWLLHKLITEVIALRPSVKSLSIGWASGGEHAQGLMARNKHLMPAPILPPEWLGSAENLADKKLLEERMLKLPHLEDLTLKNCWISPHALGYLVQEHPGLERLCLESVSLTAEFVHSNGPNPHQIMAMAQHLQGPLMPAQAPPPAQQPQTHQAFLQAVQNVNNLAGLGTQSENDVWLNPRSGSWPHVLDVISPGVTLTASGSQTSPPNIPASISNHALRVLDLKSCGYCRLNNARLDESAIPPPTYGGGTSYFSRRYAALSKVMLSPRGPIAAEIVQAIPQSEELALTMGFELNLGWPTDWADEVDAPTFDGCLNGGAGRFWGAINRESRVVIAED